MSQPAHHGQNWTRADNTTAARMWNSHLKIAHIALSLKRSEYAIYCKLKSFGYNMHGVDYNFNSDHDVRADWDRPAVVGTFNAQYKEKTMLDFKKGVENVTRVFGVEIANLSQDELIAAVREARAEIKGLEDMAGVSIAIKNQCEKIMKGVCLLCAELDKDV